MCKWGTNTVVMIDGKPRNIDSCIAPLVSALNAGGIRTVASCCGHGRLPGNIIIEGDVFLTLLTREQSLAVSELVGGGCNIHGEKKREVGRDEAQGVGRAKGGR